MIFKCIWFFLMFMIIAATSFKVKDVFKMVNGNQAKIADHPYHATVLENTGDLICSGSILNTRIVLTVAHCVHRKNVSTIMIMVGADVFGSVADSIWYPIEKVEVHKKYEIKKPGSSNYDYAIILVKGSIEFNEEIGSIPLSRNDACEGAGAVITSWNRSQFGERFLQKATLPILSASSCEKTFSKIGVEISKNMYCTGSSKKEGVCQVDDGAPVVMREKLIGMVSWGNTCAKPELPSIIYNVSKMRYWIQTTIKKLLRTSSKQ